MSQKPVGTFARSRVPFPRFSIRSLLGLMAVISLSIAAFQFAWPRRTLRTTVLSPMFDIRMLEPHLDHVAEQSQTISRIQCDPATNSIMIQAQARHMDAARKEIESIIAEPSTSRASESLGINATDSQR